MPSLSEAVHGLLQVGGGVNENRTAILEVCLQQGAAQGKVVQRDGEKAQASLCHPGQCLRRPALHLLHLPLAQQQIAVQKALKGVEQRKRRLPLPLQYFGIMEGRFGLSLTISLMQGIGPGSFD